MPPDTVSHSHLLEVLIRRVESGWRPENQDEWVNLYFDLADAQERAVWSVEHRHTKWPVWEELSPSETL